MVPSRGLFSGASSAGNAVAAGEEPPASRPLHRHSASEYYVQWRYDAVPRDEAAEPGRLDERLQRTSYMPELYKAPGMDHRTRSGRLGSRAGTPSYYHRVVGVATIAAHGVSRTLAVEDKGRA